MQRRAYLIGGNYKQPSNLLSGVRADIAAWKNYLMSSFGGCWSSDEIWDLSGRSKDDIGAVIQAGRSVDYSLVCFSGHGYLAKDRFGFNATMVMVDDIGEMSERDLNPGSPWTMMILDCCRKGADTEAMSFACDEALNKLSSCNTRTLFENELKRCERGLVKVFAADVGQSADDEKSFSRVLIEMGKSGVGACENGIMHIDDAVRMAGEEMPPQQNPVYMGGRRLHHFPFAVTFKA